MNTTTIIKVKTELLPFQKETVERMKYLEAKYDGMMLFNSAGLGKTISAITNILTDDKIKKTLIICPSGLINNWIDEFKKHTTINIKNIVKYYGPKRNAIVYNEKQIIFITSYAIISREFIKKETGSFMKDSFFNKKFERIILDEAHYIRNHNTNVSKAVLYLGDINNNCKKNIITATPIFNSFNDMYSYFRFLLIEGIDTKKEWTKMIKVDIKGYKLLNETIKKYSITFKKEMVYSQLLPKNDNIILLKFTNLEQEFYNALVNYSRKRLIPMMKKIERLCGNTELKRLMNSNVMVYILRLKQACNSPWLILGKMKRLKNTKNLTEAISTLKFYNEAINIEEECPICYDTIANKIADPCGHKCCDSCWTKMLNMGIITCPKCRGFVKNTRYINDDITIEKVKENDISELKISSKIDETINIILEKIQKKEKIIIISQWVSMLDIVRTILSNTKSTKHIKYVNLQGNVPIEERTKNILQFQTNADIKLCFISLMSSAEGINLTAANNVIILDEWWTSSKMIQAIDRCHRIGQKNQVNVYKLYIENSIEQKIKLRLDQKDKLSSLALDKWNVKHNEDNYDDEWMKTTIQLLEPIENPEEK